MYEFKCIYPSCDYVAIGKTPESVFRVYLYHLEMEHPKDYNDLTFKELETLKQIVINLSTKIGEDSSRFCAENVSVSENEIIGLSLDEKEEEEMREAYRTCKSPHTEQILRKVVALTRQKSIKVTKHALEIYNLEQEITKTFMNGKLGEKEKELMKYIGSNTLINALMIALINVPGYDVKVATEMFNGINQKFIKEQKKKNDGK